MEFTGKTVEEAIENGLKELGITEEQAEIQVKEQPSKGLFGILKGKAVVEIEKKPEQKQGVIEFVEDILKFMEIDAVAELSEKDGSVIITLVSNQSSNLIGYRGEVLDSIQTLAGAYLNIGKKEYQKVVVDCENYREKREETLIALAHKLEQKATEMRREVMLEPMSPFERRIIHTALAESTTCTTRSDGKEPNRYVVIVPFDKDEFSKPYNAGKNHNDKNSRSGKRNNNSKGKGKFNKSRSNSGRKQSGFIEKKKSSSFSFGTYLGNSLKDNK